jgi:hypothetical protein
MIHASRKAGISASLIESPLRIETTLAPVWKYPRNQLFLFPQVGFDLSPLILKQGKRPGRAVIRVDSGKICQLRANGLSLRNIAETMGVSHTLIASFLRSAVVRG